MSAVQIGENGSAGPLSQGLHLQPKPLGPIGAEAALQGGCGLFRSEGRLLQYLQAGALPLDGVGCDALGGPEPSQLRMQSLRRDLCGQELAGRDIHKSKPYFTLLFHNGGKKIVGGFVQHGGLDDRARSNNAGDLSLHQAFSELGVLHLVADGHLVPGPDELGQVCIQGMVGYTRQRNLVPFVILLA